MTITWVALKVHCEKICSHLKKKNMFVLSNLGAELEPDEFMNSKKSHEVQSMSKVVACLAKRCGVRQARRNLILVT